LEFDMPLEVAGRAIGSGEPLFVIAELGLNHGGSLDRALAMVDEAGRAGASAIKLQTLDATRLVGADAPAPAHVQAGSMIEFFRTFELDRAAHAAVRARALAHGMAFISTPLDENAIDMLESVGCDAYKIASGDITYERLIRKAAATGKPVIISTGMSNVAEISDALDWALSAGSRQVALLHCVSAYPVPAGAENLSAIAELARRFQVPVGLSDHSSEPLSVPLSVAFGASIYERHLSLGPGFDEIDADVSSTSQALAEAIAAAERARLAIGTGGKRCLREEAVNLTASRRGLYAARPLAAGAVVGPEDIVVLRPANGVPPCYFDRLVGVVLTHPLAQGEPFDRRDCRPEELNRSLGHVA
jgi:sialic acid synthase SpsE